MEEATLARGHERYITYLPIYVRNRVTETSTVGGHRWKRNDRAECREAGI